MSPQQEIARAGDPGSSASIRKVAWTIAFGVLLNPLNSSMIAVALLQIGSVFEASLATVTWLITGFYLAGAIGPSLAGKLADLFGAKRVFVGGLVLVLASSVLTFAASSFGVLLALRIIQALGSTVSFPAGMAILRTAVAEHETGTGSSARTSAGSSGSSGSSGGSERKGSSHNISRAGSVGKPTGQIASALALVSIMANATAALGPVIGGFLVDFVDWRAVFWINIPIVLATMAFARAWLPADRKATAGMQHQEDGSGSTSAPNFWARMDMPGVLLFVAMIMALMLFLLAIPTAIHWWLLALAVAAGCALYLWERRVASPFLDTRMITANRGLRFVYMQFLGVNVIFYTLYFCMPLWLGQVQGFDPQTTGLLMLPIAGLGMVTTALAAKCNQRFGTGKTIIAGNALLVGSSLLLLLLGDQSSMWLIILVSAALGIPNGFSNMGLQAALYESADPKETGAASGLFVTFRSLGSILSASLLGMAFGEAITTDGLHLIAFTSIGLGMLLLLASLRGTRQA